MQGERPKSACLRVEVLPAVFSPELQGPPGKVFKKLAFFKFQSWTDFIEMRRSGSLSLNMFAAIGVG